MSDRGIPNPDKTPVFGLDDIEEAGAPVPEVSSFPPEDTADGDGHAGVGELSIVLHDKLSGVRLVTDSFPVEIGNGRRFDMALRGPGPDGLYARIDRVGDAYIIERCHDGVFMAVDMIETTQFTLADSTSVQLGDHMLSIGFSSRVPASDSRGKKRAWLWGIPVVVLVLGVMLLRLLLVADEAESRVTVVDTTSGAESADSPAGAGGMEGSDESVDIQPAPSAPPSKDSPTREEDDTELAATPEIPPISWFFWLTDEPLPTPRDSDPAKQGESPTQEERVAPRRESQQNETAISEAAVKQAYKDALAAIRTFDSAESLAQRLSAWAVLAEAEQSLGPQEKQQLSVPRGRLRTQLVEELLADAQRQTQSGNLRRAYANYHAALELGATDPDGERLMSEQDAAAESLYRFGYRLKFSDPATAGRYWQEVLENVPTQSEWHRKARLALAETRGARG